MINNNLGDSFMKNKCTQPCSEVSRTALQTNINKITRMKFFVQKGESLPIKTPSLGTPLGQGEPVLLKPEPNASWDWKQQPLHLQGRKTKIPLVMTKQKTKGR